MSYSMIFKPALAPFFISILSEHSNFATLEKLAGLYRTLTSEQYLLYMPIQLYYLFGGSLFTIETNTFKDKVISLLETLGKTLSANDNVTSRHIDLFKNSKERKGILDESVKIVLMSKNKETVKEVATQLAKNIFNGKDYLNKE